jgi:hypothetical protein
MDAPLHVGCASTSSTLQAPGTLTVFLRCRRGCVSRRSRARSAPRRRARARHAALPRGRDRLRRACLRLFERTRPTRRFRATGLRPRITPSRREGRWSGRWRSAPCGAVKESATSADTKGMKQLASTPALISAREASTVCGVSVWTIRRWAASGALPAVRPTPRANLRFRTADLRRLTGSEDD